jgi:hypothetical protein
MMRVRGTTMNHFIDHTAILGHDMSRLAPILRKITHVQIAKLTHASLMAKLPMHWIHCQPNRSCPSTPALDIQPS